MSDRDIDRELELLEAELKRLEAEYNMYLRRPPAASAVGDARPRRTRWSSGSIACTSRTTGDRFRFNTLQSRFQTFADLWDRGLRAREEGRPVRSRSLRPPTEEKPKRAPRTASLHVTTFSDPMKEMDKLHELYDSLAEARREVGEDAIPVPQVRGSDQDAGRRASSRRAARRSRSASR